MSFRTQYEHYRPALKVCAASGWIRENEGNNLNTALVDLFFIQPIYLFQHNTLLQYSHFCSRRVYNPVLRDATGSIFSTFVAIILILLVRADNFYNRCRMRHLDC